MSKNFDILEAMWLRRERKRRAQKMIEGTPPLTYTAKNVGTLKNYRIYGNTVDGESVGDRTENLFDGFSVHGKVPSVSNGELINSPSGGATTEFIAIDNGDITLSKSNTAESNMYIFLYAQDKSYIGYTQTTAASTLVLTGNNVNGYQNAKYARIRVDIESVYMQTNIMLNAGSTPLPYELYGYKVPVTVSNGTDTLTTPIYLPEPIRKVGNEAEYIDYGEQKQYFADGTSVDVTLPALPTIAGTNTLSVGTQVQPSSVKIEGKIKGVS